MNENMNEKLEALKIPLPKEAISQHPTKPYLSTIKAIYVVERFNEVFGLGGWQITNEFIEKVKTTIGTKEKTMVIIKSKFVAGDIIIESYGGNDNEDLGDAYKGACTDALTKIGSYLGVGMDVFKGLADNSPNAPRTRPSVPLAQSTAPAVKTPVIANSTTTGQASVLPEVAATDKQYNLIRQLWKRKKEGEWPPDILGKTEASKLITELLNLPNEKKVLSEVPDDDEIPFN